MPKHEFGIMPKAPNFFVFMQYSARDSNAGGHLSLPVSIANTVMVPVMKNRTNGIYLLHSCGLKRLKRF